MSFTAGSEINFVAFTFKKVKFTKMRVCRRLKKLINPFKQKFIASGLNALAGPVSMNILLVFIPLINYPGRNDNPLFEYTKYLIFLSIIRHFQHGCVCACVFHTNHP